MPTESIENAWIRRNSYQRNICKFKTWTRLGTSPVNGRIAIIKGVSRLWAILVLVAVALWQSLRIDACDWHFRSKELKALDKNDRTRAKVVSRTTLPGNNSRYDYTWKSQNKESQSSTTKS